MKLFRRRELSHEAAWSLLPWLAQGTLEGRDLRATLDHLKICEICREELRFLPELRSPDSGFSDEPPRDSAAAFSRLAARIDALGEATPQTLAVRAPADLFRRPWRPFFQSPSGAGLLLALALGIGWSLRPASEPALFRVLSSETFPEPSRTPQLRVVFAPETPEKRLREILLSAGAELAKGPSRTGVYTVSLLSRQALSREEMARLRSLEEIQLLEPVMAGTETRR